MLRWVFIAVGILVVVVIVTYVGGMLLPRTHTASVEGVVGKSPIEVAAILRNVRNYPDWRDVVVTDVAQSGAAVDYVEIVNKDRIAFRLTEPILDQEFLVTMTDPSLPFGGTWTIKLTPQGSGSTRVDIREDGEVRSPIFRVFAHFVFGYTASMKTYLEKLGATEILAKPTAN